MHILAFGDSIANGFHDPQNGGWTSYVKQTLINQTITSKFQKYSQFFSLGIAGDTSEGLLKRIENEIIPRHNSKPKTTIIIAIGTNDSIEIFKKRSIKLL